MRDDDLLVTLPAPPTPNPDVRARTLALALDEYDRFQGQTSLRRPKRDRGRTAAGLIGGAIVMKWNLAVAGSLAGALLAGVAVVAIGPMVGNLTGGSTTLNTLPGGETGTYGVDTRIMPRQEAAAPARTTSNPPASPPTSPPVEAESAAVSADATAGDQLAATLASPPPPPPPAAAPPAIAFQAGPARPRMAPPPLAVVAPGAAPSTPTAERQRRAQPAVGLTDDRAPPAEADVRIIPTDELRSRDSFREMAENPAVQVAQQPVSTVSIDVDTASYAFARRTINAGSLPPPAAVRVEEFVNYFDYDYPAPASREQPFSTSVTVMPTPWNPQTQLLRVGLRGYDLPRAERPRANLVFLLDVSGSMDAPDKLPLVTQGLRLLVDQLGPQDTVGIVVYAGASGTVLEPTSDKAAIRAALGRLSAGGSTAGGQGILRAYALARQSFDPEAVNRVILATDGDFNVGVTDPGQLEGFVAREREAGIYLTVLGFGQGNYQDSLMQRLAQTGNGVAAYIDTLNEARRVLVEEAQSALFPIANDVKIQIEFNPARVAEYRLIGYETRALERQDFANDAVDAGEIGAGHTVTALYEITPVGSPAQLFEPLRYGAPSATSQPAADPTAEFGFLRIRYKLPGEDTSRLIERAIGEADRVASLEAAGDDARFAAAVAAFAQKLRGGRYLNGMAWEAITALAEGARGRDAFGLRAEFVQLTRLAASLPGLPVPR